MPWYSTHPHRASDFITKMANVNPGGPCPLWLNFIEFVTNGDRDLALYLQKLCGYALVGVRNEQMFAFLYGGGNNGKSVFLQTIAWVMGDYAVTVDANVFMWSPVPRHTEELMPLRGARLVIASEIEPDAKWNLARIKQITGGERIRARGMGQNSVEFTPQCLLIMAGNEKPHLKSVDVAIKRRLHLIPFTAQVGDEMRDKNLPDKLRKEGGGVLAWMIEGCRLWQEQGLDRPTTVETATAEYIEDEDYIRQWFNDCAQTMPFAEERSSVLFNSWKNWTENSGIKSGDIRRFSVNLAKLGFTKSHANSGTVFKQISLKTETKVTNRDG